MNPNALFWRNYTALSFLFTTCLARANEKLTTRREGQDFLEYIVIVGFALMVVAAIGALYAAINGLFGKAAAAVGGLHF